MLETRSEITKHEAGQMNNHCAWFENQYGKNAKVDRFMIIPTRNLAYEGDFTHEVRIIRKDKLKSLKKHIKSFIKDLQQYTLAEIPDSTLVKLLSVHYLNVEDFIKQYSEEYYHMSK